MILVITAKEDYTTTILVDWLIHYSIPYLILSDKDIIKIHRIDNITRQNSIKL